MLAVLLWSTVASAFKFTLTYLSPLQLLLFANLSSASILSILVSYKHLWHECFYAIKARIIYYIIMGFINPFLYYIALFKAYELLPAQQAQSINYTWSITLSILSAVMFKQRLSYIDIMACCLAYLGALIIATKGYLFNFQFTSQFGVICALLSTIIWAFYWILNTKNTDSPMVILLLSSFCSLPFVILACFFLDSFNFSYRALIGAVYIGLFEMGVTFVFWLTALRKAVHISRIANLIFLSPFLSLFFISSIIGERIQVATLLGLTLIIIAVYFQQRQKNPKT